MCDGFMDVRIRDQEWLTIRKPDPGERAAVYRPKDTGNLKAKTDTESFANRRKVALSEHTDRVLLSRRIYAPRILSSNRSSSPTAYKGSDMSWNSTS